MLSKWLFPLLLILTIQDIVADIGVLDVAKFDRIYYNPITGLGLKGKLENTGRFPFLNPRIGFRGSGPCNCEGFTCSCCTGINLPAFNFNRRICTDFTYDPEEFAIRLEITANEKVIFRNSLSAKNPPPICVPFPHLPLVKFCVRFFDIYIPGKNLHACVDFETRVIMWPVLALHFNCFKLGADGVSWTKPDGSNVIPAQAEVSEPEIYDDVAFELDPVFLSDQNQTSVLTPEQEASIGQLKL